MFIRALVIWTFFRHSCSVIDSDGGPAPAFDGLGPPYLWLSGTSATARHQPALAALIFTGRHETKKPCGRPIWSRLVSFSIWQYSHVRPAKWAGQMYLPSPVRRKSATMSANGRSSV